MYRSILIIIIFLFFQLCCTNQKAPEIIICVEEGKLSDRLLDTERYECDFFERFPVRWIKYPISDCDILFLGESMWKSSYFLYSKKMNKAYYYQESDFYKEDITFFDSLYFFIKGSSLFLDHYATVFSEPIHESALKGLLDGTEVYKVSSVDLFTEEWQRSILPYIEELMYRKRLSETFISNAIEMMEKEVMSALADATDIYVLPPYGRLVIYVFKKSPGQEKSFVYYEFEI